MTQYILTGRGGNLVWKLGVVGPAFKTGWSWALQVRQTKGRSTGL